MNTPFTIRQLHSLSDHDLNSLTDILIDCVTGGASVSFMHPLSRERALAFWRQIAAALGVTLASLFDAPRAAAKTKN